MGLPLQVEPHLAGEHLRIPRLSFSKTPTKFESLAEGLVQKISNNLHQPALMATTPMCPLHIWRGKWKQNRVFALEIMSHTHGSTNTNCCEYSHPHSKIVRIVEEAKQYHLNIIIVSSTKRRGSGWQMETLLFWC